MTRQSSSNDQDDHNLMAGQNQQQQKGQIQAGLRSFQQEAFESALERNTIVFGATGTGKSHVAIQLLKMQSYFCPITKTKRIAVFLAPTQQLVAQMYQRIMDATLANHFNIGYYYGREMELWDKDKWLQEIERQDILAMTPDVLLNILDKAYYPIHEISLIIFDECHHCRKKHPYRKIMRHYDSIPMQLRQPRIFGTTSCPTKETHENLRSTLIEVVIPTTGSTGDIAHSVAPLRVEEYIDDHGFMNDDVDGIISSTKWFPWLEYTKVLSQLFYLSKKRNIESEVDGLVANVCETLVELGEWCFLRHVEIQIQYLGASSTKSGTQEIDSTERFQFVDAFLLRVQQFPEKNELSGISRQLERILLLLAARCLREDEEFKTMLFVRKRVHCRLLYDFLSAANHDCSSEFIGCVLGQSAKNDCASHSLNAYANTLDRFTQSTHGILVATEVMCEGIDIPMCRLVIIVNELANPRKLTQMRGRARHRDGVTMYLLPKENEEARGKFEILLAHAAMIDCLDFSWEKKVAFSQKLLSLQYVLDCFEIESSGAIVSMDNSICCLMNFCQSLPGYTRYGLQPKFHHQAIEHPNSNPLHVVRLFLPVSLNMPEFATRPMVSKYHAMARVCLLACRELYSRGLLDDHLNSTFRKEAMFQEQFAEQLLSLSSVSHEKTCLVDQDKAISIHESLNLLPLAHSKEQRQYFVYVIPNTDYNCGIITRVRLSEELGVEHRATIELLPDQINCILDFHCFAAHMLIEQRPLVHNHDMPRIVERDIGYAILPIHRCGIIDWKMIKRLNTTDPIKNNEVVQFLQHLEDPREYVVLPENRHVTLMMQEYYPRISPKELYEEGNQLRNYRKKVAVCDGKEQNNVSLCGWYTKEIIDTASVDDGVMLAVKAPSLESMLRGLLRKEQPLQEPTQVQQRYVIPTLCTLVYFPHSLYTSSMEVMKALFVLERKLSVCQLQRHIGLEVTPTLLDDATSKPVYERLESLGDTILKLETTWYLYCEKSEVLYEGTLSQMRMTFVKNSRLYDLMLSKELHHHIYVPSKMQHRPLQCWSPPFFPKESEISLGSKIVADVFESLAGAYFTSGDHANGRKFLKFMGIPVVSHHGYPAIPNFKHWKPFPKRRAPAAFSSTSMDEGHGDGYHLEEFQGVLGYTFKKPNLLLEALTHPSCTTATKDYQRLEFFGDAIIEFVSMWYAFQLHPNWDPNDFTDWKKVTLSNDALGLVALLEFQVEKYMLHGIDDYSEVCLRLKKERLAWIQRVGSGNSNGDVDCAAIPRLEKFVADLFESLVGAVFVDSGYDFKVIADLFFCPIIRIIQPVLRMERSRLGKLSDQ